MMIQPAGGLDFYRNGPTTPQEPQNLLRPTNKGCGTCTALQGLSGLRGAEEGENVLRTVYPVLSVASGAMGAYHGYKRNNSVGWGIWWFLMGSMFPVITPVIAFAQGFGKRA